jgi:branched-chain amino acid transport system substrate-binding protein
MNEQVTRRDFLSSLGVSVGAAVSATSASGVTPAAAQGSAPPKGKIPDTPLKFGHMTFLTGPAAVLGEPSLKGHILAAEEINAHGGILGKRKIETVTADEAAGTDANVKELRRMKLSEKIDMFTGVISSGNTPALGPVAEELGLLTIFVDGCTDFLWDKAVPNPKYTFRITNIQSADGVTCAVAVATTWPNVKKIAHIHPDYSYGRNAYDHINIALNKLIPGGVEVVSEGWPKLGTTDFTAHITKAISANPDLIVSSVWGGDYVAMYKQGLRYGMFKDRKFASTIAFGVAPHAIGKDHPEGVIAGVHSNYYFTFPPGNRWPANKIFVEKYYKRWNEYPNFQSDGAYHTLYMYKTAVEKANRLTGGWPDEEAIISQLEGMYFETAAGNLFIRPDNHQGYKDAVTGFSKNVDAYPFQILDPDTAITIPIRNITAPPNWPKPGTTHNDPTATYNWIKETWPQVS